MFKVVNGITVPCSEEDIRQREIDELEHQKRIPQIIADENNRELLIKLRELDMKSIRSLREGNKERLAELESEAVELRKGLIK